jgi:hypothetical protein
VLLPAHTLLRAPRIRALLNGLLQLSPPKDWPSDVTPKVVRLTLFFIQLLLSSAVSHSALLCQSAHPHVSGDRLSAADRDGQCSEAMKVGISDSRGSCCAGCGVSNCGAGPTVFGGE